MKFPQEFAYLNYSSLEQQRLGSGIYGSSSCGILLAPFPGQSRTGGWCSSPGMLAEARGVGNNLLNEELPKAQRPACTSLSRGLLGSGQYNG